MNVEIWECCTLDRCFNVAKFITLTPLSLLISCKISFFIVDLKISSLPTLHCNILTVFSIGSTGSHWIHTLVPHKPYTS